MGLGAAGGWLRRPKTVVIGVTTAAVLLAGLIGIGPVRPVPCLWERLDGWIVEIPEDARTPGAVERAIGAQTRCVSVEVGVVNWNLVPEGQLAVRAPGPRVDINGDRVVQLWVEGGPDEATDPCRPLGPQTAPPAGCPGGLMRAL